MTRKNRRNHAFLIAILVTNASPGFTSGLVGQNTTTLARLSQQLKSSGVATLSIGPVWENTGNTETLYLTPNIIKTYAANHASHALVDGEIFAELVRR